MNGEAKIADFNLTPRRQHDIVKLDVSVNQLEGVDMRKPDRDTLGETVNIGDTWCLSFQVGDQVLFGNFVDC
ncbi:hypothetical protein BGX33_001013 [Mortierella sp. NVP41]|nr:hypothetical protein BGX33_001013 [Mortierella sp. NVP41]